MALVSAIVESEKVKILVVYEDGKADIEAMAKAIKKHLGNQATAKVRAAGEVTIAETLAADAYAFGVDDADAAAWAELRRVFKGINLAGRRAGYFGAARGMVALKKAFKDAELTKVDTDLPVGEDLPVGSNGDAAAWSRSLARA